MLYRANSLFILFILFILYTCCACRFSNHHPQRTKKSSVGPYTLIYRNFSPCPRSHSHNSLLPCHSFIHSILLIDTCQLFAPHSLSLHLIHPHSFAKEIEKDKIQHTSNLENSTTFTHSLTFIHQLTARAQRQISHASVYSCSSLSQSLTWS